MDEALPSAKGSQGSSPACQPGSRRPIVGLAWNHAITLLLATFLVPACNRKPAAANSPAVTPTPVVSAAAPSAKPPPEIVATVGKETISFETVRITAAQNGYDLTDQKSAERALRESVGSELLAAEAERLGYANDPSIRELVRKMMVQRLVKEKVDTEVAKLPAPAAAEVKTYYEAHPAEFTQPTLVKGQILFLVRREGEGQAEALATRRNEVEKVVAEKAPFPEAVKRFSDDPSKIANAGVTNWIVEGQPAPQHPPDVVAALFRATNNIDVAGPFETKQGLYWVRLVEKRAGKVTPLEEAKPMIAQRLERVRRQELYDKLVAEVQQRVPVQTYPERLQSALEANKSRPGPPMGPVRIGK